jgi:alpha-galactosidase
MLALTPPMGWNSWNRFGCQINEDLIKAQAQAIVDSGMKAAGYTYVNLDDCWQVGRDATGTIVADPRAFPSGIKSLADFIHHLGLQLGIYTDAGITTCQGRPGSYGHESQDATTYASWGVDYVKEDWCNTEGLDPQTQYRKMHDALAQTGRPIILSICDWGISSPWLWGPDVGNLWRTTGDVEDTWLSVLANFDATAHYVSAASPGAWNDPDMLEVGNSGMTATEDRTQFSLWAILAAPLIAGNDLVHMSETTRAILTNQEVIAVDQDAAGVAGMKIADLASGQQIWAKPLQARGSYAVALLNRGPSVASMSLSWKDIGIQGKASVRDLWAHTTRGTFTTSYTVQIPSHGVVMLKITLQA